MRKYNQETYSHLQSQSLHQVDDCAASELISFIRLVVWSNCGAINTCVISIYCAWVLVSVQIDIVYEHRNDWSINSVIFSEGRLPFDQRSGVVVVQCIQDYNNPSI
ncbi:unnamed protein product [Acanthoscelides obtectus]|uniref:Uncharacterized protein n=1 Tax=Acanthoscelides obtectus TaxID=200917 RepID=A0A9P0P145_ACAOB|nr:unnamed protein product [Acanthoscelides obtectus]CAK1632067.1 hypothetical protein AOBTE_LOCUS7342 [Acanthoscelides obtectus]